MSQARHFEHRERAALAVSVESRTEASGRELGILPMVRKVSTTNMWFEPPPQRGLGRKRRVRPLRILLLVALVWLAVSVVASVDPALQPTATYPPAAARSSVSSALAGPAVSVAAPEAIRATLEIHSPPARGFPPKPAPAPPTPYVIVKVTSPRTITSRPGGGRVLGTLPARSRWITSPLSVWAMEVSKNGRYGRIAVPWSPTHSTGWFDMKGLGRKKTRYEVVVSLSRHELSVYRSSRLVFSAPAAIGAPDSPTPPGSYFVTDRSPWYPSSSYGSFIFGLSGVQTNLPGGWRGGNLLAIHGTNNPSSIGRSVSAGCLRVSRATLERLESLLVLGAPVIVKR